MAQEKITGHARIETSNFLMIVLILIVVSFGGLVEIVPLFFQKSTTQPIEGLKPYTALQVVGRDVYIRVLGGLLYLTGMLIMLWNCVMTMRAGSPVDAEVPRTAVAAA